MNSFSLIVFWILYHVTPCAFQTYDLSNFTIPTPTGEEQKFLARYTLPPTTKYVRKRTIVTVPTMYTDCEYKIYSCLRAYRTGRVCARTLFYNFRTFKNWCMLAYINCVERYQMWRPVHMGECLEVHIDPLGPNDINFPPFGTFCHFASQPGMNAHRLYFQVFVEYDCYQETSEIKRLYGNKIPSYSIYLNYNYRDETYLKETYVDDIHAKLA